MRFFWDRTKGPVEFNSICRIQSFNRESQVGAQCMLGTQLDACRVDTHRFATLMASISDLRGSRSKKSLMNAELCVHTQGMECAPGSDVIQIRER